MEPNLERDTSTRITINQTLKTKRNRTKEQTQLFVSFGLMMIFTIIAFVALDSDEIPGYFTAPFIIVLATIQVIMQLFIFMHLNEKGNGYPIGFIFSGIFVALITVAALILLIQWS
jgi:cytochrome c oxidase subunit IV